MFIRIAIMVLARSTSFLLILILLMLPLRFSSGHATQHQVNMGVEVAPRRSELETAKTSMNEEEIYVGVPAVAEIDQKTRFLPGRKIMSRRVIILNSKVVMESDEENHKEGKGILSAKHKLISKRSRHYDLVPLNADYHVPKPHPPKNN